MKDISVQDPYPPLLTRPSFQLELLRLAPQPARTAVFYDHPLCKVWPFWSTPVGIFFCWPTRHLGCWYKIVIGVHSIGIKSKMPIFFFVFLHPFSWIQVPFHKFTWTMDWIASFNPYLIYKSGIYWLILASWYQIEWLHSWLVYFFEKSGMLVYFLEKNLVCRYIFK